MDVCVAFHARSVWQEKILLRLFSFFFCGTPLANQLLAGLLSHHQTLFLSQHSFTHPLSSASLWYHHQVSSTRCLSLLHYTLIKYAFALPTRQAIFLCFRFRRLPLFSSFVKLTYSPAQTSITVDKPTKLFNPQI